MGGNIMHQIQEILWESASLFFRPARSTNDTAIFSIYIFSIYYISKKKYTMISLRLIFERNYLQKTNFPSYSTYPIILACGILPKALRKIFKWSHIQDFDFGVEKNWFV